MPEGTSQTPSRESNWLVFNFITRHTYWTTEPLRLEWPK